MQRFELLYSQPWYVGLPVWQKELIRTAFELYSREERMRSAFTDYSFVVFPMAKAYEGYLKGFLYNSGLITREMYNDKRFRIGRALNPDVHPDRQDSQWLYQQVADNCGSELARKIWDTWLTCRNQVFHYFPDNQKKLSLEEAGQRLELIAHTIEQLNQCPILKP